MSMDVFGFRAMWSPYFLLFMAALLVLYFMVIGPWRGKFADSAPVPAKKSAFFVSGIVLLYICKGAPLDLLGHLTFSAHMTQMALTYLVVPPLLILGSPDWLLASIVNRKGIRPVLKVLTKPLVALIVFNGLFSFYHIPLIFDVIKTSSLLHAMVTIILMASAFMMWWPLLNNVEGWQTLSGIKKIGYIFADGMLLTPACALIIFATAPMYTTYTDHQAWANALELCVPASMLESVDLQGPQMFSSMSPLEDQKTGGVIMKIIQEVVYGVILGYNFFQWARKEREKDELELQAIMAHAQVRE